VRVGSRTAANRIAPDTRVRPRPEIARGTPESSSLRFTQATIQAPRVGGSRDGAVEPALRAREEIHAQAEAQNRGKQYARERHLDDSRAASPTVRAATPNARRNGAETTKYRTSGVLHDFAWTVEDFCPV